MSGLFFVVLGGARGADGLISAAVRWHWAIAVMPHRLLDAVPPIV
jgi:hypothetical protein